MALNLVDLETVLAEIQPSLTGGWIQKIHQPQDLALTLDIRSPGASVRIYICAEPRLARLHFVSKKYSNPPTPPPFCQFLRSHLEGGRIEASHPRTWRSYYLYENQQKDEKAFMCRSLLSWGIEPMSCCSISMDILLQSLKESRFTNWRALCSSNKKRFFPFLDQLLLHFQRWETIEEANG